MNVLYHNKWLWKKRTKGAVQSNKKKNLTGLFLHSLFVMVRCVLVICGHVLHFAFQNDLCWQSIVPQICRKAPEFSYGIFLLFCNEICISCMHFKVFQSTTCSSIHIQQGIPIWPDIYFCVTGHFIGSRLADVSNSARMLTFLFSVKRAPFFHRFWSDHTSCQVLHRLLRVFTHWMGLCVYFQVVPLLFLRKPKQSCLFLEGQASC